MKRSDVTVEIDSHSGFCFGVVTAIRKAEEQLSQSGPLYCLGDIVHNSDEVERLRCRGLHTISHDQLAGLRNAKVLLRAHGEPPSTYDTARRNGIEIIDATCPVVLKLQERIKAAYTAPRPEGAPAPQIVIYGKLGHAEVNGLVGQTDGTAIVVEDPAELGAIDPQRDVLLYSQTTKSHEGFRRMVEHIQERLRPYGRSVTAYDTICSQVSNRVSNIRAFAGAHDLVLFVSGAKSSNGRVLCNECESVNAATRRVANASEIDPAWVTAPGVKSIGICGATSTPRWLMEQVRDRVEQILDAAAAPTE